MPTKDEIFEELVNYIYGWESMGMILDSEMEDIEKLITQYYLQCDKKVSENP